ncbi:MAG: OmpA family protein [Bacteroidota bacterium]
MRYLLLLLLCGICELFAQRPFQNQVALELGTMAYIGDLTYQANLPEDALETSYGLRFTHRLGNTWSIGLAGSRGVVYGNDWLIKDGKVITENSNFIRALNFRSEVQSGSILIGFHFNNDRILRRNAKVAPSIYLGAGITNFETFADLYYGPNQNRPYFYWPTTGQIGTLPEGDAGGAPVEQDGNYETRITNIGTEQAEEYPTTVLQIPFRIELAYRFAPAWSIYLGLEGNYLFSDYLDDVSDDYREEYPSIALEYAANPSGVIRETRGNPDVNDLLLAARVGISFSFGKKNYAFRGPVFYATPDMVVPQNRLVAAELASDSLTSSVSADTVQSDSIGVESQLVDSSSSVATTAPVDSAGTRMPKDSISLASDSMGIDSMKMVLDTSVSDSQVDSLVPAPSDTLTAAPDSAITVQKLDTLRATVDSIGRPIAAPTAQVQDSVSTVKAAPSPVPDTIRQVIIRQQIDTVVKTIVRKDTVVQIIREAPAVSPPTKDTSLANSMAAMRRELVELRQAYARQREANTPSSQSVSPVPAPSNDATVAELRDEIRSMKRLLLASQAVGTGAVIATRPRPTPDTVIRRDTLILRDTILPSPDPIYDPSLDSLIEDFAPPKAMPEPQPDDNQVPAPDPLEGLYEQLKKLNTEIGSLKERNEALEKVLQSQSQKKDTIIIEKKDEQPILPVLERKVLFFENNQSSLTSAQQEVLKSLAPYFAQKPDLKVVLSGHSDTKGNAAYNLKLSQQRAERVKRFMVIDMGLPPQRIVVKFFGETRPLSVSGGAGPTDRRVELDFFEGE